MLKPWRKIFQDWGWGRERKCSNPPPLQQWNPFAWYYPVQWREMFHRHMVCTSQNNLGPAKWQMLLLQSWQVVQLLTAIFPQNIKLTFIFWPMNSKLFQCQRTWRSTITLVTLISYLGIIVTVPECQSWISTSGGIRKGNLFNFQKWTVFWWNGACAQRVGGIHNMSDC